MKKTLTILSVFYISLNIITAQTGVIQIDKLVVGSTTNIIPAGSPYKMAVSGGILTEKVRVATNGTTFWADFVFDKDYKLKSLPELEKFIKLNNHLPEIPSTKEVNEKGIDLAETQALLLQKIEELTLYVIQQNKEIEKLKSRVNKLSKR